MELFIDTETSGKFDFKSSYKKPHQPWICQIALILSSKEEIFAQACFLIESEGRKIEPSAYQVHGINTDTCDRYGIMESTTCYIFLEALHSCNVIVAHNLKFDRLMICNLLYRNSFEKEAEYLLSFDSYCTMEKGTNITRLPGRFGKYKWPTLEELHRHFFNRGIEGAHDALVDTKAMRKCYYEINS